MKEAKSRNSVIFLRKWKAGNSSVDLFNTVQKNMK